MRLRKSYGGVYVVELSAYPRYSGKVKAALSVPRENTAAFTGRRAQKLGFDERSRQFGEALGMIWCEVDRAYLLGYRCFYTGMASGFDLMAARCAISYREFAPSLLVVGVIPYEGQSALWDDYWRGEYENALFQLDAAVVLAPEHKLGCHRQRNQYMVDRASLLIAGTFGTGCSGGTCQTMCMARRAGLEVVSI